MAFIATVLNILIASPSDLVEERAMAKTAIDDWNELHAEAEQIVLRPLMWETSAAPEFGRPQGSINRQLVERADILLGMFGTKMGTDTGVAESGTVEEINGIVAAGKLAMLYFSKRPVDPSKIDAKQLGRLKVFQKSTSSKALTGTFNSLEDLRRIAARDLTHHVREIKALLPAVQVKKEAEEKPSMNVTISLHKNQHVRWLVADVINGKTELNSVYAMLEFPNEDGTPFQHAFVSTTKVPDPFRPDFSVRFTIQNDTPHAALDVMTKHPPEQIAVVVYSGIREIVRMPSTEWLTELEGFRQADMSLPAAPPPPREEPPGGSWLHGYRGGY